MEQKELHNAIGAILWNDWDPIGVHDDASWPKDEYASYVARITKLKLEGADEEAIAAELNTIADKTMGMAEPMEQSRKVAAKIIAL